MDKDKAKELAKILLAYSEGKRIEVSNNNNYWVATSSIELITASKYVRIKPKPKLVLFTFEDNKLFRDKWIKIKGCIPLTKITSFGYKGLDFYGSELITWKYAFDNYEFEDGSPFGKYIEE